MLDDNKKARVKMKGGEEEMGNVLIEALKCERCGYIWPPRNRDVKPVACPRCKSPYWSRPKKLSENENVKKG